MYGDEDSTIKALGIPSNFIEPCQLLFVSVFLNEYGDLSAIPFMECL